MAKWSPLIPNGFVREEHTSREEVFDRENSYANVVLRCQNRHANILIQDLLISERPYPFNNVIPYELFSHSARRIYPANKYSTDADQEIIDYDDFDTLVYVHYRRKSSCETAIDLITGDEVSIIEELEPVNEYLAVNWKPFVWVGEDGEGELTYTKLSKEEFPGLKFTTLMLKRQISGLSYVYPDIIDLVDTVNDREYFSGYLGIKFPPETLKFEAPIIRISSCTKDDLGTHTRKWDVTLKLLYRVVSTNSVHPLTGVIEKPGWNHFFRAKTKQWERIFIKEDQEEPEQYDVFPLEDFSSIMYYFGHIPVPAPTP